MVFFASRGITGSLAEWAFNGIPFEPSASHKTKSACRASMGIRSSGSVSFQFKKMGVFRLNPEGIVQDDLELDLIDHGLEEMGESTGEKGEPQLVIRCAFADFGQMQKALEDRKLVPISASHEYICMTPTELPEEQANEVMALIDKLEQDDDVQNVYHTLV